MSNEFPYRISIPIDPWSGAHIEIEFHEKGGFDVHAIDLIGDAWHDHIESLKDAAFFDKLGDIYRRNRALQASLTKLMTHFDGVVSGLYRHLAFPVQGRAPSILNKAQAIGKRFEEENGNALPPLDTDFKAIRDLLIHPYVSKTLSSGQELNQSAVFNLSLEQLHECSVAIDHWLGQICEAFDHERGYNTEGLSKAYAHLVVERLRNLPEDDVPPLPPFDELDLTTYRI
jgi:hypothetical protein